MSVRKLWSSKRISGSGSSIEGTSKQNPTVHGRLDGTFQRDGELTPDAVAKALSKEIHSYFPLPEVVEQRPPALCQGCGHRDMYTALNEGRSWLPWGQRYSVISVAVYVGTHFSVQGHWFLYRHGASITMAKGASDAGVYPYYSVIGDSTFTHSGMTGLWLREWEYHDYCYLRIMKRQRWPAVRIPQVQDVLSPSALEWSRSGTYPRHDSSQEELRGRWNRSSVKRSSIRVFRC